MPQPTLVFGRHTAVCYTSAISTDATKTEAHLREDVPSLTLVVTAQGGHRRHTLPTSGAICIGRAEDATIRIEHPSISRRHALLHVGARLELEDVDSSNGSYVHGRRLAPGRRVELFSGDSFEVGSVLCVLRGGAGRAGLRQLRTHGSFERRLGDELSCAGAEDIGVGIVRLSVQQDSEQLVAALLATLSPEEIVAQYAACEYELLVIDTSPEEMARTASALASRLSVRASYATFPGDGQTADELLAVACSRLVAESDPVEAAPAFVVLDERMRDIHKLLPRVGRGQVNVLLLGETGVGKEVLADALHACSPRADAPLVRLNCAAFTESLLEAELFGYEKGAFTGATARKIGLLESATGGMVFLDEIGELAPGIQAKLLRVIESGTIRRLGGLDELPIDVVYVAATHRDLQSEIAAGRFRSDLYFRLNGFSFDIPPLRQRGNEILPLAEKFAAAAAARLGECGTVVITAAGRQRLCTYGWPGNIRELRNAMERATLLAAGAPIDVEHLPLDSDEPVPIVLDGAEEASPDGLSGAQLEERRAIVDALARCHGNQTKAARDLGISRRWLSTKMARYGIRRARD